MNTDRSLCVWMQSGDRLRLREGVDVALMALSIDIPVCVCLAGAALIRLQEDTAMAAPGEGNWLGPLRSLQVYGLKAIHVVADDSHVLAAEMQDNPLPLRLLDVDELRDFLMQYELWYRV